MVVEINIKLYSKIILLKSKISTNESLKNEAGHKTRIAIRWVFENMILV